jgi:hypothetical protein
MNENRRPLALNLMVGIGLLLTSAGLALHDLMNSNRLHELEKVPFVVALMIMNVVLQLGVARHWALRLRTRSADPQPLHLGDILLGVLIAAYQVCSVVLLLAASGTWASQLAGSE